MAKTIGLTFPKEKKTNKGNDKKSEGAKKPEGSAPAQTPEQ